LRAKARAERAGEEETTVLAEMEFTIRWYRFQQRLWQERARRALQSSRQGRGHHAYAEKQVLMWKRFAEAAKKGFPVDVVE
jgi:hypothetical protein